MPGQGCARRERGAAAGAIRCSRPPITARRRVAPRAPPAPRPSRQACPLAAPLAAALGAPLPRREVERADSLKPVVAPYIIDLETVNGTFVNDKRIEASRCARGQLFAADTRLRSDLECAGQGAAGGGGAAHPWCLLAVVTRPGAAHSSGRATPPRARRRRYYELLERDVIRFGLSTREYVILNDKSAG